LPGSEVKIAADGEILLKGPGVFTEYYKNPEATREAIDPEGWFHSGDIGAFDEAGFLRITDRKKNLIITSGGKNIAPANIENLIMGSDPYISQAMVYGDRQKYLVALITLDEMALKQWAAGHGKGHLSFTQLTQDAEVVAMVQKTINKANQSLAQYETVKYFRILPEEVTVENGMLTPTLKLKRREVVAKYEGLIQEMYRES
jgi:long-chain acyl-CoA synthetase